MTYKQGDILDWTRDVVYVIFDAYYTYYVCVYSNALNYTWIQSISSDTYGLYLLTDIFNEV